VDRNHHVGPVLAQTKKSKLRRGHLAYKEVHPGPTRGVALTRRIEEPRRSVADDFPFAGITIHSGRRAP
jgi:hypothetical protein